MENLKNLIKVKQPILNKGNHIKSRVTKSFQAIGIDYVKKLGGTRKDYGRVFKAIKEHPAIAGRAFQYSVDANHPNRIQLFFWRFNDLLKGDFHPTT